MKAARVISIDQPRAPQVEDGYTRIANELFDAILGARLSSQELNVMMAVIRKTYGYNKKQDDISASQIGALCKIERTHVTATLKKLEAKQMIHKRTGSYGCVIGIQKDYSRWAIEPKNGRTESVLGQNRSEGRTELVLVDRTESVHTKDNLPKDNQQKTKTSSASSMLARFDAFWLAYPKKVEKKDAKAVFLRIAPDDEKLQMMLQAIDVMKRSGQADDKQFIAGPAKWLRGERWNDEIQVAYSADELVVIAAYNTALADVSGEIDAAIFSGSRAGAIRHFRTLSEKPEFWLTYFKWVAQNATLPPSTGFDWLISSDGFSKVKGGQFNKR